ncbi:GlxA family transcriptional regulator [Streptomyces parvulus]|uniref:GlxA family transcriptional regulator n=1 Tax=Streptomyces parvulus TaxID=146923 RepID=UPI001E601DBB|nr:GlxA family transcriptional regulator [Streptomyces parvulus]MCC9155814.1 GlxA family transcriptional regulator [Streptomyces parvulus]MCE7687906.1 GlxA family transcriptional regulator [Streptomyces parvulus]
MGGVAHPGGDVVVIVAFDQVQLLDVAGPLEVFTAANRCAGPRYDVRVVSPDGHDTVTSCGLRICVDASLEELPEHPHTLVVPGRRDWRRATADAGLVSLVAALAARTRRVTSVCAGAFVLAHTGALDGRRATTHWELAAQLASAYPGVRVEPDLLFVRDRHLVTSAGVTAGIDMALALVEEDHGADVARDVARQLVVFMARPGGQSQFSVRMTPPSRHPLVRRVMDVITADPSVPSGMDALAAGAGISTRHLNRLFRQETGMTPGRYVDAVRLEAAKALLSSGTATVGEVARQAGFGSPEAMRRLFQNTFGVSPTVYRARFRSTSASA